MLLAAVLITGILAGGLLARYRSNNQRQAEMIAAQFHVSSDYLKESNSEDSNSIPSYNITDWKDGFEIQLYNYEKENTALISDENISYEVKVSSDKWEIADSSDGVFKDTLKVAQNADGSMQPQTAILVIKPKDSSAITEGSAVTVTVNTTAPFTKTLSATFTVKGKNQPDYSMTDKEDGTILLTIQTNSYSGKMTISWDAEKYAPDNTNTLMTSWTGAPQQLVVQKNTTYELLFFKKSVTSVTAQNGSGTTISLS